MYSLIDKAGPELTHGYLRQLCAEERHTVRGVLINIEWLSDRMAQKVSGEESWTQCLSSLFSPDLLPTYCASAVSLCWPFLSRRLLSLYSAMYPRYRSPPWRRFGTTGISHLCLTGSTRVCHFPVCRGPLIGPGSCWTPRTCPSSRTTSSPPAPSSRATPRPLCPSWRPLPPDSRPGSPSRTPSRVREVSPASPHRPARRW